MRIPNVLTSLYLVRCGLEAPHIFDAFSNSGEEVFFYRGSFTFPDEKLRQGSAGNLRVQSTMHESVEDSLRDTPFPFCSLSPSVANEVTAKSSASIENAEGWS